MISLIALFCFTFIVKAQSNPTCLQGWSYFEKSNKCFKVFGGEFDSVRPLAWDEAEEYCKTFNGGHLASFHSDDEVTFVVGLTQKINYDDGFGGAILVGHKFIGNNGWEWSDGSPWTYTKWWSSYQLFDNPDAQSDQPYGRLYTLRYFASTLWIIDDSAAAPFACQMLPSSEG